MSKRFQSTASQLEHTFNKYSFFGGFLVSGLVGMNYFMGLHIKPLETEIVLLMERMDRQSLQITEISRKIDQINRNRADP